MEQGNKKVDGKRLLIAIGLVLFTALVTGGLTWYLTDKIYKQEREANNKQIQALETQIKQQETKQTTTTKTTEATTKDIYSDVKLPIISFSPDTFTEQEKNDLKSKIINPFIDWHNLIDNPQDVVTVVQVEKYGENEAKEMGYTYKIDYITKGLNWGGWLERKIGEPIAIWTPECMGECSFTDAYKTKYPEVYAEYQKKNKP